MRIRLRQLEWPLSLGVGLVVALTSCGGVINQEAVWNITGKVTGAVSAGVTLQLDAPNIYPFTTTDDAGAYAFHYLYPIDHSVTPSLSGYTFTPDVADVTRDDLVAGVSVDFTSAEAP